MQVNTKYISAGCNQAPHALSLHQDNLIYGACNGIIKAKICEGDRITAQKCLTGHEGRVNCVRWLDKDFFVSSSTDKTICIWKNDEIVR